MTQYNVQLQDGNGSLAGLRNQLINGQFEVWQRGTAISNPAGAYTADRWYAPNSGNVSRSGEGPAGLAYSASITGGADGFLYQGVELPGVGLAGAFDVGTTWTLSFYVKTGASTQSVYSIVDFSDSIVGVNTSAIYNDSSSPFTATTSWQRVTRTFTISSTPNAGNGMLRVLLRCDNRTETLKYAGAQLEPGPIVTPFEQRPIALELSLCQRYYISQKGSKIFATPTRTELSGANAVLVVSDFFFPTQMRTTPTVNADYVNPSPFTNIGIIAGSGGFRLNADCPTTGSGSINGYVADAEL